jgi:glucose/mannose transport system permease protein
VQQLKSRNIEIPGKIVQPKRRWLLEGRIISLGMLAPSVIAILVFVYGFIAWTGAVSVSNWHTLNPDYSFVGLQNYIRVFGTSRLQTDIRNILVFTAMFLMGCLAIGLLLALLLETRVKGEAIFRAIFLFPMTLSFVVTGTVWQWLFAPGEPNSPTGLNLLFQHFGLNFFQDWSINASVTPGWDLDWLRTQLGVPIALLPVVVAAVWQMSGFTMAIYIAGLRTIPDDLREAARVDGATEWQLLQRIILPLLRPITLSVVIILGHISLKIFDLILTQTGGGPGNATDVPGIYMYETTFKSNKYAEGAAIAIMMLLVVALFVIPYLMYNFKAEAEAER